MSKPTRVEAHAVAEETLGSRTVPNHWPMLPARIHELSPLICMKSGGAMPIIRLADQGETVRESLLHLRWPIMPPGVTV